MKNVSFAKQINGGWSIIGLTTPNYATSALPVQDANGNPVVECSEGHDHLIAVMNRTRQLSDLFCEKIQKTWDELRANLNIAGEDYTEDKKSQQSAIEFHAQGLAFAANCSALSDFADSVLRDQAEISEAVKMDVQERWADQVGTVNREDKNTLRSNVFQLLQQAFGPGIQLIGIGAPGRDFQARAQGSRSREKVTS